MLRSPSSQHVDFEPLGNPSLGNGIFGVNKNFLWIISKEYLFLGGQQYYVIVSMGLVYHIYLHLVDFYDFYAKVNVPYIEGLGSIGPLEMDHFFFLSQFLLVHPKWHPKLSGQKPVGMTQVIWDAMDFLVSFNIGSSKTPQKTRTFPTKFHHIFCLFY